ncbi:DNA mismatch repair protein MutT [Arthrobacter sp. ERGS1:01]|uniref:NUDIX domain-containing protein n=1 Tax=Arthrobacter sp. ERGS1:01 TaxID=1704044 RepID=UPI0006B441BF|nr:NUDIX domain-containing protein [Arthrobacter sp. ERGS1:01]ALE06773.1 DNA mismatch repair protein MutT [Arthrobacter sp. ERGS1:01]
METAERFTLTPVSYVIFRRGDAVLLQLRQGTGHMDGHWATAAAGHVEAHESVAEAARREAREEIGVVIAAKDLLAITTMHRPAEGRVDFFFSCESWSDEPRIMEPDKSAGLAWFDLDDLPGALVPHERYVLENLRAGLPPIVTFGVPSSP